MDLTTMGNEISAPTAVLGKTTPLRLNQTPTDSKNLVKFPIKKNVANSVLAESKAAAAANITIDPSTAIEVAADTSYSIGTASAGQQLLVKIKTDTMKKLSAVTSFNASTVFQTFVFTLDAQNNIKQVISSVDVFGTFDVVSFLPSGGYYYVLVYIASGGGEMQFLLSKSDTCSAAEPNDVPSVLPIQTKSFGLRDFFDNINDLDSVHLKFDTPEKLNLSFVFTDASYNTSIQSQIEIYIYNVAERKFYINGILNVPFFGTLKWTPPAAGEYYIYIKPAASSANLLGKEYMFSAVPDSVKINQVHVGNVTGIPDSGVYGGYHWVTGGSCVVYGTVDGLSLGSAGYPAVPLQMNVYSRDGKEVKTAYTLTDQNGAFRVSLILPYSEGKSGSFEGYSYVHAYDIQKVVFYDLPGNNLFSDVDAILNVTE